MPYRVIFFENGRELGSKMLATKTEAIAYAERTKRQFAGVSSMVVDGGTHRIVRGEPEGPFNRQKDVERPSALPPSPP
jgi:hypothetical protein